MWPEDVCGSFDRQLPELANESEVLGRGDSSLKVDSCRDFPLLSGEVLVAGTCTADGSALSKHNRNFLLDASVDIYCKAIHSVSFGCKPRVNLRVHCKKHRERRGQSVQHTLYLFRTTCKYRFQFFQETNPLQPQNCRILRNR